MPNYKNKKIYPHIFADKLNGEKVRAVRFSFNKDCTDNFVVGIDFKNNELLNRIDVGSIISYLNKFLKDKIKDKIAVESLTKVKADE